MDRVRVSPGKADAALVRSWRCGTSDGPSPASQRTGRAHAPGSDPTNPEKGAARTEVVTDSQNQVQLVIRSANVETLRIIERVALGLDASAEYDAAANTTPEVRLR